MALNSMGMGIMLSIRESGAAALGRIHGGLTSVQNAARSAGQHLDRSMRQFATGLSNPQVQAGMTATGAAMSGVGLATSAALGKSSLMFADFQQQMLNIQAISGMTKGEFDDLSSFAIQLGADTKFSATQAANAMYEISAAGITGTDAIKDMTKGVAAFAAAGGIDLPTAASGMVSAMKSFNIEAEKSGHVADVFAKAQSISSFRANEFEMALSQVGGVANMVGQTLEQTTSGLMAMRNSGISASDGATSLKTALLMLVNPTSEAEAMLNQLGVKVRDAQGNMKAWPDIVGEFEGAFSNLDPLMKKFQGAASMTNEELDKFAAANHLTTGQLDTMIKAAFQGEQAFKEIAMSTVFGQDGIRAMAIGLEATTKAMRDGQEVTLKGSDALKEWENQMVNSQGAAQKMADVMNSGLSYKIEEMKGAAESAAITLGQRLEPAAGWLVDRLGALFDIFNSMPAGMQTTIGVTMAVVAVLGVLGGATLLLLGQIPSMIQGAKAAGTALSWMGKGASKAGSGFMTGLRWIGLHTAAIVRNTFMAGVNFARWIGGMAVMGAVRLGLLAWTAAQWALNVALNANPIALIVIGIAALVAGIVWAWNNVEWFRNGILAAVDWIVGAFKRVTDWFAGLGTWVQIAIAAFAPFIGIPLLVITHWDEIKTFFSNLPGQIMGFLSGLPDQALQWGKNLVNMLGDGIAAGVDYVKDKVVGVADTIKSFLGFGSPTESGPGATSDRWIPNMIGMLTAGLDAGAKDVGVAAAGVAQAANDQINGLTPTISPALDPLSAAPIITPEVALANVPQLPDRTLTANVQLGELPTLPAQQVQADLQVESKAVGSVLARPFKEGAEEAAATPEAPPVNGRPVAVQTAAAAAIAPRPIIQSPAASNGQEAANAAASEANGEPVMGRPTFGQPANGSGAPTIIQLMLDGQILQEILMNLGGEMAARGGVVGR